MKLDNNKSHSKTTSLVCFLKTKSRTGLGHCGYQHFLLASPVPTDTGFNWRIMPSICRDYVLYKTCSASLHKSKCFEKQVLWYYTHLFDLLSSGSAIHFTFFCSMPQVSGYVGGSGHPCIHPQFLMASFNCSCIVWLWGLCSAVHSF